MPIPSIECLKLDVKAYIKQLLFHIFSKHSIWCQNENCTVSLKKKKNLLATTISNFIFP